MQILQAMHQQQHRASQPYIEGMHETVIMYQFHRSVIQYQYPPLEPHKVTEELLKNEADNYGTRGPAATDTSDHSSSSS